MTSHQRERTAELRQRFTKLLGEDQKAELEEAPDSEPVAGPETAPEATAPARGKTRPAKQAPGTRQPPQAGRHATAKPVAMPVAQRADTARPRRLMVPLSADEDRALKELRLEDAVPAAARIRAMLQLYRVDPRWRRKVDQTIRTMR